MTVTFRAENVRKRTSVDSLVRNFFLREVWNNVESKKWREVCFTFYSESLETQILHSTIVEMIIEMIREIFITKKRFFFKSCKYINKVQVKLLGLYS